MFHHQYHHQTQATAQATWGVWTRGGFVVAGLHRRQGTIFRHVLQQKGACHPYTGLEQEARCGLEQSTGWATCEDGYMQGGLERVVQREWRGRCSRWGERWVGGGGKVGRGRERESTPRLPWGLLGQVTYNNPCSSRSSVGVFSPSFPLYLTLPDCLLL